VAVNDESSSSPAERVDLEAAAWLVKQDRGLTATEQDEFLQWLAAHPGHQAWFARHRATWNDFDLLARWQPEHSADPNPDLLARRRPRITRTMTRIWSTVLATAACVGLAWVWWPARVIEAPRPRVIEIVASAYERRTLDDGSMVDLKGGSRIVVRYTDTERRVALVQGEAQFTVATNLARPFIVRAGKVDVRAVGTAFNVRLAAQEVEILVTEGKVQLDHPAAAPARGTPPPPPIAAGAGATSSRDPVAPLPPAVSALSAGQRTVVSFAAEAAPPQVIAVTAEDMNRLLAWQPQLLDFDSTPLSSVVAEFNRRNRAQMTLADDELARVPIVASFRSDNIDGFIRLLELTVDVRAERRGADEIVLRKVR
jgi:transmembrane sensor